MPGGSEFGAAVGKIPPRETELWKASYKLQLRVQFQAFLQVGETLPLTTAESWQPKGLSAQIPCNPGLPNPKMQTSRAQLWNLWSIPTDFQDRKVFFPNL